MSVQARIPPTLAALHNFIVQHDVNDISTYEYDEERQILAPCTDLQPGMRRDQEIDFGRLVTSERISVAEKRRAESLQDQIADAMWRHYLLVLEERMDIDVDDSGEAIQAEALD
ncbi:hypothetical protein C8R42DRAFT_739669 [Lentinula raphanica]|nr:hypothetical protein C8R42DRAFT_739669 [Lentinula raphanica]